MSAWIVFQRTLELFVMMMLGYFCYRRGWLDDHSYNGLSKIVVNILNPMIIVNGVVGQSAQAGDARMVTQNLILVGVYFLVLILVSAPVAAILHVTASERYLYRLMLIFSNVGFMGIPIIGSLYGDGVSVYIAFYILGYNLLLYTYGVSLVKRSVREADGMRLPDAKNPQNDFQFADGTHRRDCEGKTKIRRVGALLQKTCNAGVVACLAAVVIFLFQISVPDVVQSFVSYTGNAAVPMSMILIGASMARQGIGDLFADKKAYIFLGIRLLLIPILSALIVRQLPLLSQPTGIFCLMMAMPIGSIVVLLASEQRANDLLCARICILSTLLSVVTIPIVTLFLG